MEVLVSAEWLCSQIDNDDVILLDTSLSTTVSEAPSEYVGSIIPSARRFDIKNIFSDQSSKFPNTLLSADKFEKESRKLGINKDSRIVVYDNRGVFSSPRVWWMFRAMGHINISVLDGGLPGWINDNHKVIDSYNVDFNEGDFDAIFDIDSVTSYIDIKQNIVTQNALLIDARSRGRFDGSSPEPRKNLKSGKIENSINLPYTEVLNNGKYKPVKELKEIFENLEIGDQNLIFTCGSGMTACIILLAYHLVNHNRKMIFDGSWTEWATKEGLLIENEN